MATIKANSEFLVVKDAIFLYIIQLSIISIEVGGKFALINSIKNQWSLDQAIHSLKSYFRNAIIWSIFTLVIFYLYYGIYGALMSIVINTTVIFLFISSYMTLFKSIAKRRDLKMSFLFE
jgi:hypothetical protein